MGRRAVIGSAIPACPRGHRGSGVVRAGTYGAPGKRRQLWWCRPVDGSKAHRFSELMPRATLEGPAHACAECETHLAVFEGPQHARNYEFPARQVAAALVAVGQGVSYYRASKAARRRVGGSKQWSKRTKFGANGTMAADWVGTFGPVVRDPVFTGESWPEVVALDELPFLTKRPRTLGRPKQDTSWVVYGAYGHPPRGWSGQLFRLGAAAKLNSATAADWLRSIPGRPRFVVCDGTKMWPKAISLAWPRVVDEATGEILAETPTVLACRWHLARTLDERLRAGGIVPPRDAGRWAAPAQRVRTGVPRTASTRHQELRAKATGPAWHDRRVALASYEDVAKHPLVRAGRHAFDDVAGWDRCLAEAGRWSASTLATWMHANSWIRDDLATRDRTLPKTIGGLEAQLRLVRDLIGARSSVLTNAVRTQTLLDLMTLHLRNQDDPRDYASRIRTHLEAGDGAPARQRIGVTGGPRLHT